MKKERKKESSELKWFTIVFILSFILSIVFSFISTSAISSLDIVPAVIMLFLVVFIGIVFDVIGVSVTVAKESDFHAKASKKIPGAKTSLKLIKNSAKVSNVCADVIGDIAGVLSGSISALIAFKITSAFNMEFNVQFIISAIVASLTIAGKAIGKGIAQRNSTEIIAFVGKILRIFNREGK
ncbi:MAG: hypothetical protein K6B70_04970 [Clostridia bacterium]|nr:hypothetical protein [Clostridia bacterium]